MKAYSILDCTLRDGGFVNDWHFGMGSIKSVISRLDMAGIDIIEVGFIDDRRTYDPNRSIVPDTDSIKPMLHNLHLENSMIVAMIDYGTCSLEKISDKQQSCIDGIRVIFKKKNRKDAVQYCGEIAKKGYKIFVQPVSITEYSTDELIELINDINKIKPYSVSIVDTYGLLHKKELIQLFEVFDNHVDNNAIIGYHAHNNFQLAYANAIELMGIESGRTLMIDGSLYGMGKGAGNANTELLAMYMNDNYGKSYEIEQLLEAIDVDITKEYEKKYWGYSLLYFISASNDCHPEYVKYLIEKKNLSIKSINTILSSLEKSKKLSFDKEYAEKVFLGFVKRSVDDTEAKTILKSELKDRELLIVGPGKTIETEKDKILNYINDHKPIIISINFVSDHINPDFVFISNSKRYSQFYGEIHDTSNPIKVIATSNISQTRHAIDYVLNFDSLSFEEEMIRDNPFLMILKLLATIGIKKVNIAGIDGYEADNSNNYFGEYTQYLFCKTNYVERNDLIKNYIVTVKNDVVVNFITSSKYDHERL